MKTSLINGIPVYEALVNDEDCGMVRISLVDAPAVLSGWQTFKEVQKYAIENEEQRLVRGVVMRADFPIYRRGEQGEYYVIYKADTIRQMAEKYLKESRQNNVDEMHNREEVEGVEMVQFFIKEKGVNPEGFEDIAEGSLFAEFHITNDEIWDKVKDGTYQGFSLEGFFGMAPEPDQTTIDEIVDDLEGRFSKMDNQEKQENMAKVEKILAALRAGLEKEEKEMACGRMTTDKGILEWAGEEEMKVSDRVTLIGENEERLEAEDGEYRAEDKTIIVAGGEVTEIKDNEVDFSEDFKMKREQMAQSYDEKYKAIADAIYAVRRADDFYIEQAGDDFAVAYAYDGKYYRYPMSWENEVATVGEPEEVKPAFVPVNMMEDLSAENETLKAEVEALRKENEELKAQPAAQPAHEEVKGSAEKTGNKGLDRLAQLMGKI